MVFNGHMHDVVLSHLLYSRHSAWLLSHESSSTAARPGQRHGHMIRVHGAALIQYTMAVCREERAHGSAQRA